jgi:predicted dehydrogenase
VSQSTIRLSRRRFLVTTAQAAGLAAIPQFIPGAALGLDGMAPPSEQILVGGIGVGSRGGYHLSCYLEQPNVRVAAVCDVKTDRRERAKKTVDTKYGNSACAMYTDLRDLLARDDIDAVFIATGSNWHATAAILAAYAGKDVYCEKPCSKNISQSLILADVFHRTGQVFQAGSQRRNLPHFQFAVELARSGKLGKLHTVYAHPAGLTASQSSWPEPMPRPPKEEVDWDLCLGPAAWRPFNTGCLSGFNFEKGGGMVGGGVVEWGTHTVDICQWALGADGTAPVEYNPPQDSQLVARYANGVKLVMRHHDWLPLGSCPVRFEGDAGWVETGDSGKLALSSPELLAGRKVTQEAGFSATNHIREFLHCVRTRGTPLSNVDAAIHSHIACHAANIAIYLDRKLTYDPVKNEFPGDDAANRLRSEALREPWRV